MKIAVFPGSFDPITKGHEDLVKRALPLFDKIIIAMGVNTDKRYYFGEKKRLDLIKTTFANEKKVEVAIFKNLTAFFCKEQGANFLIRGLRNSTDFNYEYTIANLNATIGSDLETVFFMAKPAYSCYSSTVVREIIKGKGNADLFLPEAVVGLLD